MEEQVQEEIGGHVSVLKLGVIVLYVLCHPDALLTS